MWQIMTECIIDWSSRLYSIVQIPKQWTGNVYSIFSPDGGHLVSILYTVVICILGITLPVREALQEKWLTTYVEAVSHPSDILWDWWDKLRE